MNKEIEVVTSGTFIDQGWKITTSIIRLFGDLMNGWKATGSRIACSTLTTRRVCSKP